MQAAMRGVLAQAVATGRGTEQEGFKLLVDSVVGPGGFHLIGGLGPFEHSQRSIFGRTGQGWALVTVAETDAFCEG